MKSLTLWTAGGRAGAAESLGVTVARRLKSLPLLGLRSPLPRRTRPEVQFKGRLLHPAPQNAGAESEKNCKFSVDAGLSASIAYTYRPTGKGGSHFPGRGLLPLAVIGPGSLVSKRKRKSRAARPAPKVPRRSARKKLLVFGLPVLLVLLAIGICAYVAPSPSPKAVKPIPSATAPLPKIVRKAKTLDQLLGMAAKDLGDVDIAEMNLLCATGLPGAEKLDIDKAFARLDDYAERVRYWTDQSMWDFRQNPSKFENSEAKFRVLLLISVLQKDFGVHYNDRGERNCDFSSSKNPFIHGMIDDTNGGTCASMPVMYVAVGRRLGYPMSLVLAKTHIFARWDDGTERFNIEGTNLRFDDHPDSYYRKWPYPISDAELKQGWYLKPLTPADELAVFLQNRAYCLMDNGRFKEAQLAFTRSYQLAPQNPLGREQIAYAASANRPAYRPVPLGVPVHRFVDELGAPMVYRNQYNDIERINEINRRNMQRMMRPPQVPTPGVPQSPSYAPPNPYGPQPPRQPGQP